MYSLSLQIKPPQIRQSHFFPRKASTLPAAKANGPGREALPRQLMCRQEGQTCKWQVCGVAELGVSGASGPPWSTKTCAASSLPPPKLPLNFYSEASPCHFPATYSLPISPVLLPSHDLPGALHSLQSHPPPSPVNSPPISHAACQQWNAGKALPGHFPPLLQHCPMPLLTMLGSLGCCVPATYAHAAAYHASLGRPTIVQMEGQRGPWRDRPLVHLANVVLRLQPRLRWSHKPDLPCASK